jgi:hypothetical protein
MQLTPSSRRVPARLVASCNGEHREAQQLIVLPLEIEVDKRYAAIGLGADQKRRRNA